MSDPEKSDDATLVAGEETHENESGPPRRTGAPDGLSDDTEATIVAGDKTHEIEQKQKKD